MLLAGNLPPFASVCVIVEEQDHYLVIENPAGFYTFPAGFVRWREHPIQAAQREGEEETGLHLSIDDALGLYANSSSRFDCINCLTIVFHAKVVGGELHGSIEGQPCWIDELTVRSKMSTLNQHVLDEYLRSRSARTKPEVPGFLTIPSS